MSTDTKHTHTHTHTHSLTIVRQWTTQKCKSCSFTWCNPCEGTPGGKQPAGHDGAPKPRQPSGPVPLPVLLPPTPPIPPLCHLQTANELFLPLSTILLSNIEPPFWFLSTFFFNTFNYLLSFPKYIFPLALLYPKYNTAISLLHNTVLF